MSSILFPLVIMHFCTYVIIGPTGDIEPQVALRWNRSTIRLKSNATRTTWKRQRSIAWQSSTDSKETIFLL